MRQTRWFPLTGFGAALAFAAVLAGPAGAQLVVGPFVAPSSFYVIPRNGAIVLSWSAILNPALVGYNVYRRESGRAADANVLMNATPLLATSALDAGADNKGLENGKSYIYSLKAVYLGTDGKAVEGPPTRDVVATPHAPIKGIFTLYDIETLNPGSASVDASNVLSIQGSGADVWNNIDAHSFLAVPVSGDFQVTIKLNERPSKVTAAASDSGKVGLQIKTDLRAGSPYAYFFASVARNPEHHFEGRGTVTGDGDLKTFSQGSVINSADAVFPVWLRLVRKGNIIQAFIALDAAGANFQQVGTDQDFGVLPPIVQVGVAVTSHADGTYVLGKLDYNTLKIENPT